MDRPPPPPRFWSIDALRGACAIVVFLSHWHLWCTFVPRGQFERFIHQFLENGHELLTALTWPTGGHHPAVLAFFVLSGFCIHYPAEWRFAHGDRTFAASDYYRRRARRILPVYWVASLLGLLLVALETWRPSGDTLLQFHAQSSLAHTVLRFTGLAGIYPEEIFVGNYILNTVAAEITAYFVYPLFHRLAAARRWRALGATFLVMHLGAIGLLKLGANPYWLFNSLFMLGLFWFVGALVAHGFVALRWRLRGRWLLLAWVTFLAVKQLPYFYGLNLIKQALWGVVCAAGLLWVLSLEERRGAWGRQRLVRLLGYGGALSYSLYAVHTPVIFITTWLLYRADLGNYLVQLALALTTSIVATLACYHGIERRFYRPQVVPARPTGAAN